MSTPAAKSPNNNAADNISKSSVTETKSTASPVKKSLPTSTVKSKIPKQDKTSTYMDLSAKTEKNVEKNVEKPATPTSSRMRAPHETSSLSQRPSTVKYTSSFNPPNSDSGRKRVLENQFTTKKNRYVALRQDIVDKQKSSEKAFEELFLLREKIVNSGGRDPGRLEDVVPAPSIAIAGRPRTAPVACSSSNDDEVDLISMLETCLQQMNDDLLLFCREALQKRKNVLSWLIDFDAEPEHEIPSPYKIKEEIRGQLDAYKVENTEFEERLDMTRQTQQKQIDELVQRVRCLWHECQVYKKERQGAKTDESTCVAGPSDDTTKEMKADREKLAKARAKIREQESAINSAESKLKHALDNTRQLETLFKQKEATLEQKTREFVKLQKSHDVIKAKLDKRNDNIESRVAKLKEELGVKENEAKKMVAEYKKQVQVLERDLEKEKAAAREFNETMEKLKSRNAKLEEKCQQLLEMHNKCPQVPVSLEEENTEYDIQLFNDLRKTKRLLAEKEEMLQKLQQERDEIMAATNHESDSSKEQLTSELLKKTNELQSTRNQFVQLQKNYQKMQQRAEQLELRMSEMSRLQAQLKESSGNSGATGRSYGTQVMQLQQQLADLRGSLNETNKQNTELEKTCAHLQLKVDRYKRYLHNLEGDMKLRNEARSLLQHGDEAHELASEATAGQGVLNTINIEEYQHMCLALESKEVQLMKLEKLVKQMEKQEEYSQTQRTRLESRIADLEFALKEGKLSQRNRGFSFL